MAGVSGLRVAALAFAALALTAGVLQLAAFASAGWIRHLVLGIFACAVGLSVGAAVIAEVLRSRSSSRPPTDRRGGNGTE
ncbi:Transmembrane protein [Mycobacterium sp. smrl_JER01]